MVAIITADIVNSRNVDPDIWMPLLKKTLGFLGKETQTWEIYRGDSLQIKTSPLKALKTAILLKSTLRTIKGLDIRIAIGIGNITYENGKITEANGTAFVNSGTSFEKLKKNTLSIKSPWSEFDKPINIMFNLAGLTMNHWTATSAEIVVELIKQPKLRQVELAEKLNKTQSNISAGLKRAGFDEIQQCIYYYEQEIKKLCYS